MPRQLAVLFSNGTTEYWLTVRTFEVGDTVTRDGRRWIVSSITTPDGFETRTVDGDRKNPTIALRPEDEA